MKAVLQRVAHASVAVHDKVLGSIDHGFVVFLGVAPEDSEREIVWMLDRILGLRVFADDEGKMNKSLRDVGGALLVISQFTLFADTTRGRRPSFFGAANPEHGKRIYELFIEAVRTQKVSCATGEFGADMLVTAANDGPVTIVLESAQHDA